MDLVGVKAHDVRAFAASKAFYGGISMDQIMQACHWKSHNTFSRFYLRDLAGQDQSEGSFHLGTFIAAQQVMPPSDKVPGKKTGGGARSREPPRRGVSESSDTVERGLHPFKVTRILIFTLIHLFSCCFHRNTCTSCSYQEFFPSNFLEDVI